MQARASYVEREGVASIWLDDGKVNVMSTAMLADIASRSIAQSKPPSWWCCARSGPVFFRPASI